MTEWISVKDRLPKKNGKYLCFKVNNVLPGGYVRIYFFANNLKKVDKYDFYDANRNGWYDYDSEWGYYEVSNITHWMPLPEPPN